MWSSTSSLKREVMFSIACALTPARKRTRISVFDESDSSLPGSVAVASLLREVCDVCCAARCQFHLCNRPAKAAIRINTRAMERLSQRLRDMIVPAALNPIVAALEVYQTQLPRGGPIFISVIARSQADSPSRRNHLGAHLVGDGCTERSIWKIGLVNMALGDFIFADAQPLSEIGAGFDDNG